MSYPPILYIDPRSDSAYTIYLDEEKEFSYAVRYTGSVGVNGRLYEDWEDIPQPHRTEIEKLIDKV